MTPKEQLAYTRAESERIEKASAPHEATIKMLKEYHSINPKAVEQAVLIIRDAIEYNLKERKIMKNQRKLTATITENGFTMDHNLTDLELLGISEFLNLTVRMRLIDDIKANNIKNAKQNEA